MLKKRINIGDFIAIYTDVESENFGLGRLIAVSDDDLVIESIDPSGREDGLALYNFDAICKIEKDTQYSKRIQELMKMKETKLLDYKFKDKNLLLELLKFAQDSNKFVQIELQNSHISGPLGIVIFYDDSICEIEQFDEYGQEDGTCVFLIGDISSVKWNSIELKDILSLSKM